MDNGNGLLGTGVAGHDTAHGGEAYRYALVLLGASVYEVSLP